MSGTDLSTGDTNSKTDEAPSLTEHTIQWEETDSQRQIKAQDN